MKTMEIPGVRGFIARVLLESPDTPSKTLYQRAVERYPLVEQLTIPQFHGRYVLPVRRELKRRPLRRPSLPKVPETFEAPTPPTPEPPAVLREGGSLLDRLARVRGPRPPLANGVADGVEADGTPASTDDTEPSESAAPELTPSLVEQARAPAPAPADPETVRSETRTLFYKLALEIEMAATRSELVDVLVGVDRYVDQAIGIARR